LNEKKEKASEIIDSPPETIETKPEPFSFQNQIPENKVENLIIPLSESLTPAKWGFAQWYEAIRIEANALNLWGINRFTAANLPSHIANDMLGVFNTYPDPAMIKKALQNYAEIFKKKTLYDIKGHEYGTLKGFIINGVMHFCDDANPLERFRKKTTEDDVLSRIRGLQIKPKEVVKA
jgi:hypothetical protein